MSSIPQGRLLIGKFGGVDQVQKKDGTAVTGMFEVVVVQELADRDWQHRAVYFATDQDGELSKMQKAIDSHKPKVGDIVAVKITTRGSLSGGKAYSNDTAIGLVPLSA